MFVSSHLMSEMALTADHLIVVGKGRVIADASTAEVIAGSSLNSVLLRSPRIGQLAGLLEAQGMTELARSSTNTAPGHRPTREAT